MKHTVQQSLPSADPLTGGHLPWADIFPMYELLSNLIQPLMNGHLLNVPEGTLSLSSADRRHIKFVYFEKNFKKRSSLRDFESRCDKSHDNCDFLWGGFILANQGVLLGRMSHASRTVLGDLR